MDDRPIWLETVKLSQPDKSSSEKRRWLVLIFLAAASLAVYLGIAWLSRSFVEDHDFDTRPIPLVLILLLTAMGCYLAAIAVAVRLAPTRRLLAFLIGSAIVFRLALVVSHPIQEVDIYRYLWDGAVSQEGVSPFRYSPRQVLFASADASTPAELRRLVELRESSPALAAILSHVHFRKLPTVYPPVSQAVFAASAAVTPRDASVYEHVVILKSWFLLFDLATLALVVALLRQCGKHPGWCVAYGWCPLLMKEIANSGHLDTVAIFLCTLSVFLAVGVLRHPLGRKKNPVATIAAHRAPASTLLVACASVIVLALAVGAKLYPVVLAPLLLATFWKRLGPRTAALAGCSFGAVCVLVLWPMAPSAEQFAPPETDRTPVADGSAMPPAPGVTSAPADPSAGLATFFHHWEMNDFLFMLLVENVKPAAVQPAALEPPQPQPWFAVTSPDWRSRFSGGIASSLETDAKSAAFFFARAVTSIAFLCVAGLLAWRAARETDAARWLQAVFLTLAWFWLLSPTQNPWYWCWVLPFVAFVRGRAWLAMSGLVLLYYLRFWFEYVWPQSIVPGLGYPGGLAFDFVITWLEFAPWFAWLGIDFVLFRRRAAEQTESTSGDGPRGIGRSASAA